MLTVEDIITPDKFISLAQSCLSERRNCGINFNKDNNIFFVKTDYLDRFIHQYLQQINSSFILITHDSDNPVDNRYLSILENRYLIKWFGMNCHIIHNKLQPVPIGVANECWPHGDKQSLLSVANEKINKTGLIYSNFSINTNLNQRNDVNNILKDLKSLDVEENKKSYLDYLITAKKYKFIISPPGNSVDCHRIWESIYIGTIPIVLKSIPMLYFKDCPILFINRWEDLHNLDLNDIYHNIMQKSDMKSKFSFYRALIQNISKP